jgi:hypothetical protein
MYFIPEKEQEKGYKSALDRALESCRFDDECDEFEFKAGFRQGFEAGVEFANLYITLHSK